MISGECPYCEWSFFIPSPEDTPQMGKVWCEKCGEMFWEYYSRIDPRSYLPEEVVVNEKTKSVKFKEKK